MTSHDRDLVKWAPSRLYRKRDGIGQTPCSYERYLVYFTITLALCGSLYTSFEAKWYSLIPAFSDYLNATVKALGLLKLVFISLAKANIIYHNYTNDTSLYLMAISSHSI